MPEEKTDANVEVKLLAVCGFCRHHQKNPYIEFNFGDSKVYFMCAQCSKMNEMDFSKPIAPKYPKPRGI
jgi:hypothetical protein